MDRQTGGWALITGGAKRLGAAVALKAGAAGWNIVLHCREANAATQSVADQIKARGQQAVIVVADFSDLDATAALMGEAAGKADAPLSALVNSAGIFEHDVIETFSPALLDRHMRINVTAPLLLSKAFAAQCGPDRPGSIVNFLDYKLAQPYPDHFSYTVSKFALGGATDLLARALAPHVRVNAIAPAYVLPSPGQDQAAFDRQHGDTPLGYGATPADVADAALYLLEARGVTGQTIFVDAGQRFVSRDRDFEFS